MINCIQYSFCICERIDRNRAPKTAVKIDLRENRERKRQYTAFDYPTSTKYANIVYIVVCCAVRIFK